MIEFKGYSNLASDELSPVPMMEAIASIRESLEWADRAKIFEPLYRKLLPMMRRRFNRQLVYFLDQGLPYLDTYFEEVNISGLADGSGQWPITSILNLRETVTLKRKPPKSTVDNAVDSLDGFAFRLFDRTFEDAVAEAVIDGAKLSDAAGLHISFNLASEPVQIYLRNRSAEKMGRDIDQTTKDRLRTVIADGYQNQVTRRQLVKDVKALYRGFTARVPQKNIGSRAELIVLTELGNAMSYGTLEGARDLEARGITMEKKWGLASGACPICQANADQEWIPIGSAFASGAQAPTQHPACRCTLITRAKP